MERIEIKTTLTQADWLAYQTHWSERNLGTRNRNNLIAGLFGALIVIVAAVLGDHFAKSLSVPSLIAGFLLCAVASYFNALRARRATRPDSEGYVLGPCTMVFDPTGIDIAKTGARTHYVWSVVADLAWTDQHLFVWLDRVAAFIVPLRDLPPGLDVAQLREEISAFRRANARDAAEPAPLPSEQVPAMEPPLSEQAIAPHASGPFKRFIRAYGTLLLGRTPAADDLMIPARFVLPLPAVGMALWLIVDRWRAGADAEFLPHSVLTWSWYAVILLALVGAASGLARPRLAYERILLLTAAFVPVFLVLELAGDLWVSPNWAFVFSLAIAIYAVVYLARVLRSLTGRPQARATRVLTVILFATVLLTYSFHLNGTFWYADEGLDEEDSDYWADMKRSEALMFAQPQRIDAAASGLQRPAELPAAAFFVGFAGQGDQRVFAGEIALARKVVAAKFGSAERSLLLVNDRRDLETLPLASPTALRYALKGVAAHMRLDTDVLFLSLSSHGSRDGELSVSNGFLDLNNLSADDLATALRESGIKWRVIIVSACYAGKFIDPLRDDSTIIIAAAAADRTSFGCSDDRDLTYFGEAFYRDALPGALDLRAAFEKASEEIAARERTEGKQASNPTAYFGLGLVEHLQSAFPRN